MDISKKADNGTMTLTLSGRLDTNSSPALADIISTIDDGVSVLILDLGSLSYMSSAGLRVVLSAQKKMKSLKGKMIVKNVNSMIMEVFEVTGFVDILTIE